MSLRESLDDGILRLTLDRPEKRNALTPEMLRALRAAFARARDDERVRSVLLTGAGAAFCAGGDFEAMRARQDAPEGAALATHRAQQDLFGGLARDMLSLEKPVVLFANGDAFGAGLSLVLAADHVVAAPAARFAATFVKVGLLPDTAGTWLLVKTLGLRDARRLAMRAQTLDAKEAERIGIVVELGDLAKAEEVAREWAQGPTRALGFTKRALVHAADHGLDAALAREAGMQGALFTTADHLEGVRAFAEKRPARFEGR